MPNKKARLTQSLVDKANAEEVRYVISDTEIAGFRLVVTPTGKKAFYFRYRVGGGRGATIREPKIGDWPALRTEMARSIAADWSADVRKGGDPGGARLEARRAPTMSELFARYLSDHAEPNKKRSSLEEDKRLIRLYLDPEFGRCKVSEVNRSDIDRFHKSLSAMPYRANRALALLSKAFNLAEVWGWRSDRSNPVYHVKKFTERKRQRFLSQQELAKLGATLRQAELDGFVVLPARTGSDREVRVPISAQVIGAIRLLVLTGARRGEILELRWDWIDFDHGRALLPDSKTGEKVIVLSPAAIDVLRRIPRIEGNPYVISGGKAGAPLVNIKDPWLALREVAGLKDLRIHDLRHSFASVGAAAGASLPIIGALLGHSQPSTTARYAHLADDPLQAAAADIGRRVLVAMGDDFSV